MQEKPLQTTNQVKANLINANMIKGDMILTKPGQGRSNQKVTFVQKQVLMKPNELKTIGVKKPVMVSKGKFANQPNTKIFATKDGKLIQVPMASKTVSSNLQVTTQPKTATLTPQQPVQVTNQGLPAQQQLKAVVSAGNTPPKIKPSDVKKEKRKLDGSTESLSKGEETTPGKFSDKILESQY